MKLHRAVLLLLGFGMLAVEAASPVSSTVFGVDPDLAAGAQALQFRQYDEGIRLTLQGLKSETSRKHRGIALSNLCAGYAGTGQYAKALEACNEALGINGRNWRAYNNRALAYLGLGQLQAAREDLARGLELRPESPTLKKVETLIVEREARAVVVAKSTGT